MEGGIRESQLEKGLPYKNCWGNWIQESHKTLKFGTTFQT